MIAVEKIDVWGFEHAIRGMRNPMNSWDKSDTPLIRKTNVPRGYGSHGNFQRVDVVEEMFVKEVGNYKESVEFSEPFVIGKNDLDLMRRLYKAGTEHRKYLRQIFVSMDITAPLYWWKEFDTYKVGTVANSCSTMHKIAAKEFEFDDFSYEHLQVGTSTEVLDSVIQTLNFYRQKYLETKDKKFWWQMIQLLPSSYNQKRTITATYENVVAIIKQRSGHKLDEWRTFVSILKELPCILDIIGEADEKMC